MRVIRPLTIATGLLILVAGSGSPTKAKDLNGRFGLGLEQSLGGVSGVTFKYWPGASFGLVATMGADIVTQTDFKLLNTTIVASTGFIYNFAQSLHANFGAGLRLAFGFQTDSSPTRDNFQVDIELPLTAEFFLSDNFSIGVSTGLLIAIVPGSGAVLEDQTNTDGVDTLRFGIGAITGSVGVSYYF